MVIIEAPCPKRGAMGVATMSDVTGNAGEVLRRDAKPFECPSGCTFASPWELSSLKNYGL
jgi:hypothetical protein